jgi:hypothetical protein
MTQLFKQSKPRGRPRKLSAIKPIQNHVSVGNELTADQVEKFTDAIFAIPGIQRLKPDNRERLLSELVLKMPFYVVTKEASPARPTGRRGPTPKAHISQLIADCARAWETATGTECKIWETYSTEREAPVCTIVRVAIQILEGRKRPWAGSLHVQISSARQSLQTEPSG